MIILYLKIHPESTTGLQLLLWLSTNRLSETVKDVAPLCQIIQLLGSQSTLLEKTSQTLRLLLNVTRVVLELVKDLDVVLGILVLERNSGVLDLGGYSGKTLGLASVLLDQLVESCDGACCGVKSAADDTMGTGLFVQKVDKGLLGAGAAVSFGLGGALGEVLDGWEGLYALLSGGLLAGWSVGVDLGDKNGWFGGE